MILGLLNFSTPSAPTPSWNEKTKYIFLCRNPFDCVVSYFHHTLRFLQCYDFKDGLFDDFFELFLSGEVHYNDYFDHLSSLFNQKDKTNILFLTYEEMKEDINVVMKRLMDFLGGDFKRNCEEDGVLEKVIEATSFSTMKKIEQAFHSVSSVRKGIVGDYRSLLSGDQLRRLKDRFREKCPNAVHLWKKYEIHFD